MNDEQLVASAKRTVVERLIRIHKHLDHKSPMQIAELESFEWTLELDEKLRATQEELDGLKLVVKSYELMQGIRR